MEAILKIYLFIYFLDKRDNSFYSTQGKSNLIIFANSNWFERSRVGGKLLLNVFLAVQHAALLKKHGTVLKMYVVNSH